MISTTITSLISWIWICNGLSRLGIRARRAGYTKGLEMIREVIMYALATSTLSGVISEAGIHSVLGRNSEMLAVPADRKGFSISPSHTSTMTRLKFLFYTVAKPNKSKAEEDRRFTSSSHRADMYNRCSIARETNLIIVHSQHVPLAAVSDRCTSGELGSR